MDSIEISMPQEVDSGSETTSESSSSPPQKKNMLPWKILCMVLVILVTIGWVGIIALLILNEEWQLVLVAWLLLYAAVHFCYWYCRRNSSRTLSAQIRQRLITRIRGDEAAAECSGDCPPTYDELVKSEAPPPAYYSVVDESPKMKRFLRLQSLPWFLKKKFLEQESKTRQSSDATTVVVSPPAAGTPEGVVPSTSASSEQSIGVGSPVWKSSESINLDVSLHLDDEEEPIELPSYQTLMRENIQPVLTPIHAALASLPGTQTPPPPYSPRRLDTIAETEQQND